MVGTSTGFDVVLDLCRHEHRRILLAVLAAEQESFSLDELVTAIVHHNHHADLEEIPDGTVAQIQRSLHHDHLPRLQAAGLIEYDTDAHEVECTDEFGSIQPHLSSILAADPVLEVPQTP